MCYFLFGNYCCLDSLYSPPFTGGERPPHEEACRVELGVPGMSLPAALAPEGAVSSVLTQDTCCVPSEFSTRQTPSPSFEGTYPRGSRSLRWFRIERACVEFSNIRPRWGWHCGYRRLVFRLQLLLVLKISRPSSVICFNKKKGIPH